MSGSDKGSTWVFTWVPDRKWCHLMGQEWPGEQQDCAKFKMPWDSQVMSSRQLWAAWGSRTGWVLHSGSSHCKSDSVRKLLRGPHRLCEAREEKQYRLQALVAFPCVVLWLRVSGTCFPIFIGPFVVSDFVNCCSESWLAGLYTPSCVD